MRRGENVNFSPFAMALSAGQAGGLAVGAAAWMTVAIQQGDSVHVIVVMG